jgi:hypothetical protein
VSFGFDDEVVVNRKGRFGLEVVVNRKVRKGKSRKGR